MKEINGESKRVFVFFDGNNFYHNLKATFIKPGSINLSKVTNLVATHFECDLLHTIYYNSVPSIEDGEDIY